MPKEKSFKVTKVRVGSGTCGLAAGAEEVFQAWQRLSPQGEFEVDIVGCLGLCYREPVINIEGTFGRFIVGPVTSKEVPQIWQNLRQGQLPQNKIIFDGNNYLDDFIKGQTRIVLKRCGLINPEEIEDYQTEGGYQALQDVFSLQPDEVVEEILASGLRGRGGAGFSTGRKWKACRKAKSKEKYIICNADEGDPGAFMDRCILESDPHSLLEGMIIAGYAVGAKKGFIYIRAEYPLAVKRLQIAIAQAREKGFLGKSILGSNFDFDIEIFQGAGAFVCGESTALVLSIEGKRGMPKPTPRPRTTEVGLWNKPTLLNNVKTYAYVPQIITQGADWFASIGTAKSKGTAVFALTGKVAKNGLIEVPMGITLRKIIYEIGGGILGGKDFKAVQIGGPSGGCLPADFLDTPVDFESLTTAGSIMGSGGMIVLDDLTCMVDVALYFLNFTRSESCGKCVPCRIGLNEMYEILKKISSGKGEEKDLEMLKHISKWVKETSLCALGGTAPNVVLTTLRYFREEYMKHLEGVCPAGICRDLVAFVIDENLCDGCHACVKTCPIGAIKGEKGEIHLILSNLCIKCGACREVCRRGAVLAMPRVKERVR